MINVKFGNIDSFYDLNLILSSREISAPAVRTKLVNVEGADGSLDLSDSFGRVFYNNRTIKLVFSYIDNGVPFWDEFSLIQNNLHGKRMEVRFNDDPIHHYIGRCSVDKWNASSVFGKITVTVNADPFKLKDTLTVKTISVSSSTTINIDKIFMFTKPIIVASTNMNLVYEGTTYSLTGGQNFTGIEFKIGTNQLQFTGTGNVTITYQEGSL